LQIGDDHHRGVVRSRAGGQRGTNRRS